MLCHGLAGSLELVLDVRGSVRDADARSLVRLLDAFAWATEDGLVYLDDSPTHVSPSLMTGYAGIALTQLRLADPTRPRALSPAAVRTWCGS